MKKSNKILALLLSAVMLVSVLAGCAGGGTASPAPSGTSSPAASAAKASAAPSSNIKQLNLVIPEELSSVDPGMAASANSMQMIMLTDEGLMSFGPDSKVTYGLADSYKVSDDGLTYTFHIRDNAVWSNGDKVTAKDFLFSWQRLVDPKTASPYSFGLGASGVKNGFAVAFAGAPMNTLGISAPDDSTFVVTLDAPRSYFLYLCALASYLMPIDQKYFTSAGDQFGKDINHYLSCGPYVFSDWKVGSESYTLTKNDKYYNAAKMPVGELDFKVINDASQQVMGWDNKSLDFVSVSGDYVTKYKSDPGLVNFVMPGMWFLSFNTTDKSLGNKNLRLALSLAIDKKSIVNSIENNGSLAADYILPANWAPDSKGVNFRDNIGNPTFNTMDLTKAAQYWEAAKKDLGVTSLSVDLLYDVNAGVGSDSVVAFLKAGWEKALPGLTVNLVQTTYNDRLARMGKQTYQIGLTRWYADYPDASDYLDMWTSQSQFNYGKYNNPDYDALDAKMNANLDNQDRIKQQAQMESMVLGDAAVCPLFQQAASNLQNPAYNWVKTDAGLPLYQWTSKK